MSAIGQTIRDLIVLRDDDNEPILGLVASDFDTFEAYSLVTPATTASVTLLEIGDGEYIIAFTPPEGGEWIFHSIYGAATLFDFREELRRYLVSDTAEIVVITEGGIWTYSGDLDDPIQYTRFLIQDTAGDNPLFTDTEVAYALGAAAGSTRAAAASLVERLMARYAAMADTTELDLSVRASQIYEHYKALLVTLQNPFMGGASVVPYAGGISHSDIAVNRANTDRVRGIFDRGNLRNRSDYGGIRH